MRRLRFSPRSSFARTLLLIVTLLFASLVTTYLVVLNFAILPSLQQFNKVLAYEVRMLMTDKLQLEDGTQLVVPPAFRREIYRELGISLYSNEAAEEAANRSISITFFCFCIITQIIFLTIADLESCIFPIQIISPLQCIG